MSGQTSQYFIEQLIRNKLSSEELDAFLAGLHQETARQVYSEVLKTYFDALLEQQALSSPGAQTSNRSGQDG